MSRRHHFRSGAGEAAEGRTFARRGVAALLLLFAFGLPGGGLAAQEVLPEAGAAERPAPAAEETPPLRLPAFLPADSLQLVDRVVAIVGDTAVLFTEVLEAILELRAQNPRFDMPPAGTPAFDSLMARTLNDMVDKLVILQRAKRSDIVITKDELDQETEARFREIRNQFPSAVEFQAAVARSGRTLFQFRQRIRAQLEGDLLVNRYIQQNRDRLPPVSVSEEEIRAYFDEFLANATREATISFEQLLIEPTASEAAEDSALAIADTALQELRGGTDFAIVARRYSRDLSNRDQGGDLGWVRRGQLVPAFAEAAWRARPRDPVGPVKTRFGYHIIKVENVRGGERHLRHILIQPEIDEADVERARGLAEAVADSARQGVDMQRLADRYGVPDIPVRVPEVARAELGTRFSPSYAEALRDPLPGQVVGPFATEGLTPGRPAFAVVRVTGFRAQGRYELEDERERIRSNLLFQKGFDRFLAELKAEIYVDIRL
ncbi:MAG: peptidylprolyl isomerase [Gemmatimonadota bacterium]